MKLAVFGATGSIGQSTLAVLEAVADTCDACEVVALSGHTNLPLLAKQAKLWQPKHLLIAQDYCPEKRSLFSHYKGDIVWGSSHLATYAASDACDTLLLAISGSAALSSAWAAACSGKRILLANKESLVAAGELIVAAAQRSGAQLVPVDSEHNALWQCLGFPRLPSALPLGVKRLEITASGGPFWRWSAKRMYNASVDQACNHPNWSMGDKISVDSATMVNKALELIEAQWLFSVPPEQLGVVVHPQSRIHALVHRQSGSTVAQLSLPDMRIALTVALFGDNAPATGVDHLSLFSCPELTFFQPDDRRFKALPLVQQAMRDGGDRCLCFDISNEVANRAFREGRIPFGAIVDIIDEMMHTSTRQRLTSIDDVYHRQHQLALSTQSLVDRFAGYQYLGKKV